MQKCRFVGIPGSGKTTKCMEIIAKVKDRGYDLMQIGYCTFTRAARREASSRAAECFGVKCEDLERQGWFRTIHSAAMRSQVIPRGAIVNHDTDWLRKAMNDDSIELQGDEDDSEAWSSQWKGKSAAAVALALWDVARNRLCSYDEVYEDMLYRLGQNDALGRAFTDGSDYVTRYEAAKERDGKLDFCDLILRYVGKKMTLAGPRSVDPVGTVPAVKAFIFDECQDTSKLLDLAAQRLASESDWWYLVGDGDQSIYEWSGADGKLFMRWPVAHEERLLKSWRCAAKIMELGQRLLRENHGADADIRSLVIEPRCEGGEVKTGYEEDLPGSVPGNEPTLVMARTNQQVAHMQAVLTAKGIPWKSVRSSRRWPPLASTRTVDAFQELASGGVIGGEDWRRIVAAVPAALLQRGTKSRFLKAASATEADFVTAGACDLYGGTPALKEYLYSGRWLEVVTPEERAVRKAIERWGAAIIDDPPTIVSTIHGTKGMEADNVVLVTGIGGPVARNLRTEEGRAEERRVWYVGATRARDRLTLLRSPRMNYDEIYEALEG